MISLFRAIYKSSYPDVFTKKAFCYRYVAYLQRNTHAKLLRRCSPINCLNIRRTPFLKNTSGWLLLYIWKWIQHVPTGIHLFRVKIAKLQSTKLTIKTQISHFVVVLFFLTLNMQMSTWLNFNLSHRKKKQTRGGSRTHRSSTMELFVTI